MFKKSKLSVGSREDRMKQESKRQAERTKKKKEKRKILTVYVTDGLNFAYERPKL